MHWFLFTFIFCPEHCTLAVRSLGLALTPAMTSLQWLPGCFLSPETASSQRAEAAASLPVPGPESGNPEQ